MISFEKIKCGASAELIAHKKNRIVSIILLGFAGLFYGFGTSMKRYGDPSGIAVFIYAVSLVCLFSACINAFKDMHDIPSADVQMSMPLNSMERYFSRLLTIFYIWLLPFLISAAFGFLMSVLISSVNPQGYYNSVQAASKLVGFNLRILLYYAETVLFVISATVICQCCVGSKAESRYMPVLVMAVINFLPMAVYYSIADKFVSVEYSTLRLLSNISSLYLIFYGDESAAEFIFLGVKCLIYLAVIGCGVLIYKKRDARSVGRPIVFTAFFEVVMGLSLLLFFTVAHSESGFSLTAMFFAWLGSIILRLIVSRKEFAFSKIFLWTGLYILYYAAFLLFMFVAFKTGGFGALYKVPDISDMREAKVSCVNVSVNASDGYYGHVKKYSMEKNVSPYLSKDMTSLEEFMEAVSDAAKQQSRIKGMFGWKMFGSDGVRAYRCYVTLTSENSRLYSVEFYIPASDISEFIDECNGFKADKSYA
ncbi:MAG: hypothetical protein HDT21_03045 [Ruminococcus sp.]|nr:hypothetical protein [Ruminococcus sp.]